MDTDRRTISTAAVGAALLMAALTLGGCGALEGLLGPQEQKSWGAEPFGAGDDRGEPVSADAKDPTDETAPTDEMVEPDPVDEQGEVFVAQLQMPDRPLEMDQIDEYGAAAAAEYFLYAYTHAYGTGDTGPLLAMAGPECGFCASVVDGVAQAHEQGNYMRSPDPVIGAITSVASDATEIDFLVQVEVQMPQMRTYDASDQVTGSVPAQDLIASLGLAHADGDWVVVGAGLEPA